MIVPDTEGHPYQFRQYILSESVSHLSQIKHHLTLTSRQNVPNDQLSHTKHINVYDVSISTY